jgi:hypothetical protein
MSAVLSALVASLAPALFCPINMSAKAVGGGKKPRKKNAACMLATSLLHNNATCMTLDK